MSRSLRPAFPAALYHLTARGNARQPIHGDDHDRHTFLELLAMIANQHELRTVSDTAPSAATRP